MRCDVLVLGAGPAGSALANRLAQDGFDVRLVDRKEFPRDKPCGEFLSPQCRPHLEALGLGPALAALGPKLVRGMQLHGYGRKAVGLFRGVGTHAIMATRGFGIRRSRLDAAMVEAAVRSGARFLPRHELAHLLRDGDRVVGAALRIGDGSVETCRARWVVGADGVHSRTARLLGVQRAMPWLDQFALVAHYRGVEPRQCAEVHLFPGGFFAATTVDQGEFSVNLVVPRRTLRQRAAPDWDAFVASHYDRAPSFGERLLGARRTSPWRGVGPLAFETTRQVESGAALVGDACGYVDPLTGEGVYFALFGARALGDALTQAMHHPAREQAALAGYVAARQREIVPRLRASRALQRALQHPWLVRHFLAATARWPAFADLVVTLTGDAAHPRDLLRPSFWRSFCGATPEPAQ